MTHRTFRLALACVVLLAAVLRLWRLTAGLPDFLEEAVPFRNALDLWAFTGGRPDWNPHLFHHPSLAVYLHHFVQWLGYLVGRARGELRVPADWAIAYLVDPTAAVIPARALHVAADVSAVLAAGLLGERLRRGAGLPAAIVVALTPALITSVREIYDDTIMAALAVWSLERLLAWHERGGAWRLAGAVLLAGFATGAKYQAVILMAPLAWILWARRGTRGLLLFPLLAAAALVAFFVTTPFAVLDFPAFRRDLGFVRAITSTGSFGSSGHAATGYMMTALLADAGPAGLGLLLASFVLTVFRPRERAKEAAIWIYLLGFALPLALSPAAAMRYLLPLFPAIAVLAAAAAFDLGGWLRGPARRAALALLLVALIGPVAFAGLAAAAAGGSDTRIAARRWCEQHFGPRDLILAEVWAPALRTVDLRASTVESPTFAAASPAWRRRYLERRWFHVVAIPLSVVGPCTNLVPVERGPAVEVPIFRDVSDVNQIFYDRRLFAPADWVVTSSAVRGRYEAQPARYTVECRLYRALDSIATVAARFAPEGGRTGPTIVIYRVSASARAALGSEGPLPATWWAERIPEEYRRESTELLGLPWREDPVRRADGALSPWVLSLAPVFEQKIQPFLNTMAVNLAEVGRCPEARSFADATLAERPEDEQARRVREFCDRAGTGSR